MAARQRIAVAVVERDDFFLVGPRPSHVPLAGLWEFPGGKVEAGETPAAAAVRECREETGLDVEVVAPYPRSTESYSHGTVDLHFFACRPVDTAQPPREPFRWVPRAELSKLEFPTGNRELIRLLLG